MRPPQPYASPMNIPTALNDIRALLRSVDVSRIERDVQREVDARLAIVGPVNSGKSTLFNLLMGHSISATSPIPGTTRTTIEQGLGPFKLVDTPGFGEAGGEERAEIALRGAAGADALLVVFDAAAGLRQSDLQLLDALKRMGKPLVVVANKIDLVGRDAAAVEADIAGRLGVPVIAISAKKGTHVGERLLPALIDALPDLAVALGRILPAFRHTAAMRVIRTAMIINGGIAAEPIPFIDLPLLLAHQSRMILRIAAIYGETITLRHARELISTVAGSVALRFLAQEAAKLAPVGGQAVAAGVAVMGTWAMGQVAIQYFESGKRLSHRQLRDAYNRILKQGPPRLEGERDVIPDPTLMDATAQPTVPAPSPPPSAPPWEPPDVPAPPMPAGGPPPELPQPTETPRRFRLPFGRSRDGSS